MAGAVQSDERVLGELGELVALCEAGVSGSVRVGAVG